MTQRDPSCTTVEDVSEKSESFAAQYERVKKLNGCKTNTVFRDRIKTWWREDNYQLCYEVQTSAASYAYVRVDVESGYTCPAFEQSKLVSALIKAGFEDAGKKQPRLRFHAWDASNKVKFSTLGSLFEIDLETSNLTDLHEEIDDKKLLDKIPSKGGLGGQAASITFTNETLHEVEIFWLDGNGKRTSYGKLAAKDWRLQQSYERHVWIVVDAEGNDMCAFQVVVDDGQAIIKLRLKKEVKEVKEEKDEEEEESEEGEEKEEEKEKSQVSPDSNWTAIIRDHNVFLKQLGSEQEHQLTKDGVKGNAYVQPMIWSPDSRTFAIKRKKDGEERKVSFVESSPGDQVQPKLHSNQYQKPGDQLPEYSLCLCDAENKKLAMIEETLFPNPWAAHPGLTRMVWTANSSEIRFVYYQRGHKLIRLIAVDRDSKEVRVVIEETSDTFLLCTKTFLHSWTGESDEIIWSSERDGWDHLYLYDAKTGDVKNQITSGFWRAKKVERIDEKQRQIWFYACGIEGGQNPYHRHLCRIDFNGHGLVVLTDGDGTHEVTWSPDHRYFIDTWSRIDKAPKIELRRASNGTLVCILEKADISLLKRTNWRCPIPFCTKGRDGKTLIYGVIQYPVSYIPNKRYPVLDGIYAGPHSYSIPTAFKSHHEFQSLSELGFIHVIVDGMGTNTRSKSFHDVSYLNIADAGLTDHILFLAAAAASYPEIDLSRVGIYGTSAGGQSSLRALLDYSDIYKVAVSINGCHDNRMDKTWWNEQWLGWPIDEEVYRANSNVVHAHRLSDQAKLMLVVGEMDTNVDPASTMQVVNALIKADKDFELIVVPGRGHGCGSDPWVKKKVAKFLVRELKANM